MKDIPIDTSKFFQTECIDETFYQAINIKDGIPLPLEIEISPVDSCTRSCAYCPSGKEEIAPHTSLRMTPYLYRSIAEELRELKFKGFISICGYGECLIHENIVEIARVFNFTNTVVITNGDLLNETLISELKDAGIYKILISVYKKQEWEYFKQMVKGYADFVVLRNRYENFDMLFNNRGGTIEPKQHLDKLCYYPFYFMMIDANGDVYCCCHDWYRRSKLGNLYQHTFWEVWISPEFERTRRKILEGKRDLFPCRICNVDGTLRGKENFELFV